MASASKVPKGVVGFSATAQRPPPRSSKKEVPLKQPRAQIMKQKLSSGLQFQAGGHESDFASRQRRGAAARRCILNNFPAPNPKKAKERAEKASKQTDILVNVEPDKAATLFRTSDGLTRQEIIDQLKEEYGRGVLKAGLITLPPNTDVLPPGTYMFKRSATQGTTSGPPISSIGSAMEGINPQKRLGSYTRRTITCVQILASLVVTGALLIRAPLESGKTSTLQLLADHVNQGLSDDFDRVCYVSLGTVGKAVDGRVITFEEVWEAGNRGVAFEDLWKLYNETEAIGKQTLLLVDEGQTAFDQPLVLFNYIKLAQSNQREIRTKVILVSSWGSNQVRVGGQFVETPGSWGDANIITLWPNRKSQLPSLQLTPQEADEMWEGWLRANNWQHYDTNVIKTWIFRATERQPGTLSRVLARIQTMGLGPGRKTEPEWRQSVMNFLTSPNFFESLNNLGSLSSMRKTLTVKNYYNDGDAARSLVTKLLEDINGQVLRVYLTTEEEEAAAFLVRMGQLIETPLAYTLPSRLHYHYLARIIYQGQAEDAGDVLDRGTDRFVES